MLDTSAKWQVTAELSNNKTDRYIVTAVDLAKFINKERRKERIRKNEANDNTPVRPKDHADIWLVDLAFSKFEEYLTRFNMKESEINAISIEKVD